MQVAALGVTALSEQDLPLGIRDLGFPWFVLEAFDVGQGIILQPFDRTGCPIGEDDTETGEVEIDATRGIMLIE